MKMTQPILAALALAATLEAASPDAENALNVCPGGLAMGIVAVNYEHLFPGGHGLMVRYDYEEVPGDYTDAKIEATGRAWFLNYRWHVEERIDSLYFGPYLRHRVYDGSGKAEGETFDFKITEQTLGLNVGRRWMWKSGLNLNLAFGYGAMQIDRERPDDAVMKKRIREFEEEYGLSPLYGELSLGYVF